MKILSLIALLITSAAFADVVENVAVDTSQAPSNYVVSYDLNTTGDWYYVEAVLSDNDGSDYQFAIGESRNPDRSSLPNSPIVFAPFNNEYTINAYLNINSNYSFSFKLGRPLSIQNAKLKIIATKEKPVGKLWKEITADAPWSDRSSHQSIAFDNRIWVIAIVQMNEHSKISWHIVYEGQPGREFLEILQLLLLDWQA